MMTEIWPLCKNEKKRKKSKKGGDEGWNGLKLQFPLAFSFQTYLGQKFLLQSSEIFSAIRKKSLLG